MEIHGANGEHNHESPSFSNGEPMFNHCCLRTSMDDPILAQSSPPPTELVDQAVPFCVFGNRGLMGEDL